MRQPTLKIKPAQGWKAVAAGLMGAIALSANARAATLTEWQFDPATYQLELSLATGITPTYYIETDPPRIILDLPQTQLNTADRDRRYPGAVRQISLSQPQGSTRIVLELSPDVALSPQQVQLHKIATGGLSDRWVLYPSIVSVPSPAQPPLPAEFPAAIPKIEFGQPLPQSVGPR